MQRERLAGSFGLDSTGNILETKGTSPAGPALIALCSGFWRKEEFGFVKGSVEVTHRGFLNRFAVPNL